MSTLDADRNRLLGEMAVKTGFCNSEQVAEALTQWQADKSLPLGEILVRRGVLSEDVRTILERLVDQQPVQHGGNRGVPTAAASPEAQPTSETTQAFVRDAGDRADQNSQTLPWERPHGEPAAAGGAGSANAAAGTRFRVLELHQKGGLGQVMLAIDQELPRRVALKEIQPEFADNPASRERFVQEAEITGGLEHPGIVPVYGLGKYPDGRPYYAMRFIRGDNLAQAIERFYREEAAWDPGKRSVELRRLLRRFIDVCNAVQYAHSRGVLHRDLKPGNVMLGKYGETLVVDWGLANPVGRPPPDRSTDEITLRISSGSGSQRTLQGSTIGTPAYMSPEQAAGQIEQLGPASDVYSLGATLYCVLTGQPPFKGRERILERVKAGEFPPPRTVQPRVPRALEAICLKSMRLTAEDRYPSPQQLVEDLEHWLADEPVRVYRETWSERAGRWTRRHRAWVQSGILSLALVAAVSALAAVLVFRAWKQEATAWSAAATNFVQARESVDRWVTGVGEALAYYPVASKTRGVLLEQAAEEYERFVRSQAGDLDLELERGRTYLRLGHLRLLLRDAPRATEAYRQAVVVFEALAARHPDRLDCRMERANCETDLGVVAMETNQLSAADQHLQAAIGTLRQLVQDHPAATSVQDALAAALVNRGELLAETGRTKEAEAELRDALERLDGDRRASPNSTEHAVAIAATSQEGQDRERLRKAADAHDLLGRVLLDQGQYEAALAELNAAVRVTTGLVRLEPEHPPYLEARAAAHIYVASVLRELGRSDEEEEAYRQAIEAYRALCAALPGISQFEESLAISLLDRGSLFYQLGRMQEAEVELTEARALSERLMQAHPDFASCRATWAACTDVLAELFRDRGEFEKSEAMLREAIRVYDELRSAARNGELESIGYQRSLALCQSHLGQTLQRIGKSDEADQAFRAALDGLDSLTSASPLDQDRLADVLRHWASGLHESGRTDEAAAAFRRALQLWRQLASGPDAAPQHRAHFAWTLVSCPLTELRNPQEAVRIATDLTADVPSSAEYRNLLGAAQYRSGNCELAIESLEQAHRLRGREHARNGLFLAMAYAKAQQQERAQAAYQRAEQWLEQNLPHRAELRRIQREAVEVLGLATDKERD